MTDFRSTVTLDVELDGVEEAERKLGGIADDETLSVGIDVDRRSEARVRNKLESLTKDQTVDLKFDIDLSEQDIDSEIREINRQLDALKRVEIDPLSTLERRAGAVARSGDLRRIRDDLESLDRNVEGRFTVDSRELDRVIRDVRDIDNSVIDLRVDVDGANQLNGLNNNFRNAAAGVLGGIGIAEGFQFATRNILSAVDATRDLATAQGLVERVFGTASGEALRFGETAADAYGLSNRAALEYQGRLGQLIQAQGVARDDALEFSQVYIGLAADLASVTPGTNTEQAIEAIGAAARGEFDSLEQFSIKINQATVNQRALQIQQESGGSVTAQAAQAQALYAEILDRSRFAQGGFNDAVQNGDGAITQATAALEDARAEIGRDLLPVVIELASAFSEDVLPAVVALSPALVTAVSAVGDTTQSVRELVDTATAGADIVDQLGIALINLPGLDGDSFNTGVSNLANPFSNQLTTDDFSNTASAANDVIAGLVPTLEEAQRAARGTGSEFDSFERRLAGTTSQVRESNRDFDEAVRAYEASGQATETAAEAVEVLTRALADGTISSEEFAAASELTGLGISDLIELAPQAEAAVTAQAEATRAAAQEFTEAAVAYANATPTITEAFSGLDEDDGLDEFFANQRAAIDEQLAFFDNIDILFANGADNLATALLEGFNDGDTASAARLAAEAVTTGFDDGFGVVEIVQEDLDLADAELAERRLDAFQVFDGFNTDGEVFSPITEFANQQVEGANAIFGAAGELAAESYTSSLNAALASADIDIFGTGGDQALNAAADGLITDANVQLSEFSPGTEIQAQVDAIVIDNTVPVEQITATTDAMELEISDSFDPATEFQTGLDEVTLDFTSVTDAARSGGVAAGQAIGDGMRDGIASTTARVAAQARNLARAAARAIRFELDINSPSRVTEGLGRNTGEGFALGLLNQVGNVSQAARANAQAAQAALNTPGLQGFGGGGSVVNNSQRFGDINVNVSAADGAPAQVAGRSYGYAIRRQLGRRN